MIALKLVIEAKTYGDNIRVAHFEGDFDGGVSEETLADLTDLIDKAPAGSTLVFDFGKLNFLNSYAIGHLVEWHTKMVQKQGKIIIAGTNKNVEEIFEIVGIHHLFQIHPNVETALKNL